MYSGAVREADSWSLIFSHQVRLVAVSKTKPASDILALYSATKHPHMGENYAQGTYPIQPA